MKKSIPVIPVHFTIKQLLWILLDFGPDLHILIPIYLLRYQTKRFGPNRSIFQETGPLGTKIQISICPDIKKQKL